MPVRFDLASLELGDPVLPLDRGAAQFVEHFVPAVADEPAVLDRGGRLIDERPLDLLRQFGEIAEPFESSSASGAGFERHRRNRLAHRGHGAQRLAERLQVSAVPAALAEPADCALDVPDTLERRAHLVQQRRPVDERGDHPLARAQRIDLAQRPQDPLAQLARTHRGGRAVERAEERPFAPGAALNEVEMLLRHCRR